MPLQHGMRFFRQTRFKHFRLRLGSDSNRPVLLRCLAVRVGSFLEGTAMRGGLLKGLLMLLVSSCVATTTSSGEASLGQVHFANTCKPQVQVRFLEGIALLHSFEFPEAGQAFGQVESEDPKCVIAAWGMALSKTQRSGAGAPQKNLAAGGATPAVARCQSRDRTRADVRGCGSCHI